MKVHFFRGFTIEPVFKKKAYSKKKIGYQAKRSFLKKKSIYGVETCSSEVISFSGKRLDILKETISEWADKNDKNEYIFIPQMQFNFMKV